MEQVKDEEEVRVKEDAVADHRLTHTEAVEMTTMMTTTTTEEVVEAMEAHE